MKKRKKFPFRYGQKVCFKDSKNNRHGIIRSYGPAKIGKEGSCRIPGGPLVLKGLVLVEVKIQGKYYVCMEHIDILEAC